MSRRIKEDFDDLCDFFKKYSLASIFEEKDSDSPQTHLIFLVY